MRRRTTTRATAVLLSTAIAVAVVAEGVATGVTVGVSVRDFSFQPATVTAPRGATVKWSFQGPTYTHSATDSSGMVLFDSGLRRPGTTYSSTFKAAGRYAYVCKVHPTIMKGTVAVPITATPANGTLTTTFTIVWSSTPPAPGFVFDVQVRRPGASAFAPFRPGTTAVSTTFRPAAKGTFAFRARLRKLANGKASMFSNPATIAVR